MTTAELRRRADRLKRHRAAARVGDRSVYDWYAPSCPCGLPPGDCREHPRARDSQRPPPGAWRTWGVMAGRAFGKTRTGAEWVRHQVERHGARRVALVAATAADARDVMVEGESGLLSVCPPWDRPVYEPSKRRLTWPNGAVATTYTRRRAGAAAGAAARQGVDRRGERLEAPAAFDMLRFGLRLGSNPQIVATFTPKPTAVVKKILGEPTTVKTGGSTYENRRHLADDFVEETLTRYEGTRLGRQEIHAELLEILDGAWFPQFDPARHVTAAAAYHPGLPARLAVDAGTSGHTAAVFFQVLELDAVRSRVTVFADYYASGLYSEANAEAIKAQGGVRLRGRPGLRPARPGRERPHRGRSGGVRRVPAGLRLAASPTGRRTRCPTGWTGSSCSWARRRASRTC